MKKHNTLGLLEHVLLLLQEHNLHCYVFWWWAEELLWMSEPRSHNDIDLIYFGNNFDIVDRFLSTLPHWIQELSSKRFEHKRAFLIDDVVCELFLVSRSKEGLETNFWWTYSYIWPQNIFDSDLVNIWKNKCNIVSQEALIQYRKDYELINSLRSTYMIWKQ
jgi:hypothetical protein